MPPAASTLACAATPPAAETTMLLWLSVPPPSVRLDPVGQHPTATHGVALAMSSPRESTMPVSGLRYNIQQHHMVKLVSVEVKSGARKAAGRCWDPPCSSASDKLPSCRRY